MIEKCYGVISNNENMQVMTKESRVNKLIEGGATCYQQ